MPGDAVRANLGTHGEDMPTVKRNPLAGTVRTLSALAALVALCLGAGAQAHDIGISNVRIEVLESGAEMELAVKGRDLEQAIGRSFVDPATDQVDAEALAAVADQVVAHVLARVSVAQADGVACAATADAPAPDADGVTAWIEWRCEDAGRGLIYENHLFHEANARAIQNLLIMTGDDVTQGVLTSYRTEQSLTEAPPSTVEVAGRYIRSGIEHIFIGYDHIAFLIALLLWAQRLWPVVKVVTAFTIAHSITLALAVLDIVSLPGWLVEPLIAASIVWVAVENFLSRDVGRRWRIAFLLGLIHGFGFAGVLRAFGLPSEALGVALASFNIGVEIGQVAIVTIAVPVLLAIDRLRGPEARRAVVVHAVSVTIGALGLFWLVERTVLA